jgi:hypothetical protein
LEFLKEIEVSGDLAGVMAGSDLEAGDRFGGLFGEQVQFDGVVLDGGLVGEDAHLAVDVGIGESAETGGAPEGVDEESDDRVFDAVAGTELVVGGDEEIGVGQLFLVGEGGDVSDPHAVLYASLAAALEAFGRFRARGFGAVDTGLFGFRELNGFHY